MPRDRRLLRWFQGLRPRRRRPDFLPRDPVPPADTTPIAHSKTPKPADRSTPDPQPQGSDSSDRSAKVKPRDRSVWQVLRQRAASDIETVSSLKTRFLDRRDASPAANPPAVPGRDREVLPDNDANDDENETVDLDTPLWLDRLRPKQLENQLNQQFQQFQQAQARQRNARQSSGSGSGIDPKDTTANGIDPQGDSKSDPKSDPQADSQRAEREPLGTQFDRILNNLPSLPQLPQFDRAEIERRFEIFARNAKPEDIGKIIRRLPDMNRGPIREIWPKVRSLLEMIRDPSAAWTAKALAIGALIYLISPLDAIPDFIPFAGLVDDAALIVAVVATLARELDRYMRQSMQASIETAERLAEIEVQKYNRIVRITLLGSIATALITIGLKLWLDSN